MNALLRLCPAVSVEDLLRADEVTAFESFGRGALRTLDGSVPVCVDHQKENEIGRVLDLFVHPDAGGGDWWWARAELDSTPEWLRTDLGVSVSYGLLRRQAMPGGWDRIHDALLTEVSILTPGKEPAHPRARVYWVGELAGSDSGSGEVIYGDGTRARRYFETPLTVRDAPHSSWPVGEIVEHIAGGLVRTASGQVIGAH